VPETRSASTIEERAVRLAVRLEADAAVLERSANLAQWEAYESGDAAAFAVAQKKNLNYKKLFARREDKEEAAFLLAAPDVSADPQLKRRLDVLHRLLVEYGLPEDLLVELTAAESAVERTFSTHRVRVGEEQLTANEVLETLQTSTDRELRRRVWEGQKQIGPLVAAGFVKLMKLRNRAARHMGFSDFWQMVLYMSETEADSLMDFMDDLAVRTDGPMVKARGIIDASVAGFLGISAAEIMPWDMADPFFQELPESLKPDLSGALVGADPVAAATRYYRSIGFEPEPILEKSSLYESPGKNPHAFCMYIDRAGDVRILCNVRNSIRWHSTVLHELAHALYTLSIDGQLPWSLRQEAHPLTTEGVALLFESVATTGDYLVKMVGMDGGKAQEVEDAMRLPRALSGLLFSRWCQVMVRFEKAAYADPEQDLEALWWHLVERYQHFGRPAGRNGADWATKIHLSLAPVYYQNYVLGQAFAAQLRRAVEDNCIVEGPRSPAFIGCREVSTFLRERLFSVGRSVPWPELIRRVTGRPLSAGALLKQMELGEMA
jgi:peptidyl-dipeptidase A